MPVDPLLIDLPEELRGDLVVLRPHHRHDAAALWDAVDESRGHLAPWLPWVHGYTSPHAAEAYVIRARARWLLGEDLTMGIFRTTDGHLLGGPSLHDCDWDPRVFEIGYWIRISAQGRGYMTEAVRLQVRLAFETLKAQ